MIKKIVFDLDNTLIYWEDSFIFALKQTIDEFGIDKEKTNIIDHYIDEFEKENSYMDNEIFLNYLNEKCNTNLNMDFLNKLLINQEKCCREAKDELKDTLEYLSNKYELVVLSNWFTNCQIGRLKNAGIIKYFKKVYGGEGYLKPHPKAFEKVLDIKSEECLMIGDNVDTDIEGALKVGMKACLYNYKNKNIVSDKFWIINNLSDLKKLL